MGLALLVAASSAWAAGGTAPATPPELVATYDALADAILGGLKSEKKLVHAILATSYGHAQAELAHARQALKEEKLVFVLHVSGQFEDPDFT